MMRDFVYHHATSLDEARRLACKQGAMLLAGGQALLRDIKRGRPAPTSLVDITGIVPKRIELRDGAVFIGAGATHAEVAGSAALREQFPVLAALVNHIGDPAVRNRGTLGGALAANEPAATIPPPVWPSTPLCTRRHGRSPPQSSSSMAAPCSRLVRSSPPLHSP